MNDAVTNTEEPMTADQSVVVLKQSVSTILANDKDNLLGRLAAEIAAFKADVTTPVGRKAIASMAHKVASTKMDLIRLGKGLTEGWRASTKAVNVECSVIEERMDALKEQVRAPLTAYENREKARVDAHNEAIHAMALIDPGLAHMSSHAITSEIARRMEMPRRDWEEFRERAVFEHGVALRTLRTWCKVAEEREEVAAEAERQRAREAAEAARLQAEREETIRFEAAATAKIAAEEAAEAARVAEAQRVEQERQSAIEAEERRAEAARQAVETQRLAALEAEERARHAEEQRKAAEALHERRRIEAEKRAEREKQEAVEAARLAEVQRQQMEAAKAKHEAEARAKNVAHKRQINNEILTAMGNALDGVDLTAPDAICTAIIVAIAKQRIPHISIQY